MNARHQLTLDFDFRPALGGEDFLVSDCNRDAVEWIDAWPDWPSPVLVIFGPPGSGKSHLAAVFAQQAGSRARQATPDQFEELAAGLSEDLIVEDLDRLMRSADETPLFHLYNSLKEAGRRMLITASAPPARWKIALPDLRSRLNAAQTAEIGPPEDPLIAALLVKLFADRQVQVSSDVIGYAVNRMERSFSATRRVVQLADRLALAEKRRISIPLMKRVLEQIEHNGEG